MNTRGFSGGENMKVNEHKRIFGGGGGGGGENMKVNEHNRIFGGEKT